MLVFRWLRVAGDAVPAAEEAAPVEVAADVPVVSTVVSNDTRKLAQTQDRRGELKTGSLNEKCTRSKLLQSFRGRFQSCAFDRSATLPTSGLYRISNTDFSCSSDDHAARRSHGVHRGVQHDFAHVYTKRELRRIMQEPGHREIYRRRKCTVEPVFGQIQVGMGFRRFFYRGRQNVGAEWNLVCAAFNVKKMAALMRKAGVWANILAQTGNYIHSMRLWMRRTVLHGSPMPQHA